jgi:membrane protease YdiL (CAAX protease family)
VTGVEERRDPFWSYQDLLIILCLALPCFLLAMLLTKVVLMFVPALRAGKAAELLPAQFIGYAFWFGCLAVLLRMRYNAPFWRAMHFRMPACSILPSLALGAALSITVAATATLLRTPQIDSTLEDLLRDRTSIIIVGFFATTLGPMCEELIFRGFVLPLLVRSIGPLGGILLTAIPFALMHGPQYHWSWQHLALLSGVGCAFGWARYSTGSTAVPAVMHAGYNATLFAAYLLAKKEFV